MTEQLDRAYDLIKNGDKQSAINVLEPIIRADPDNEDAWWLYANATDDDDAKRNALNNVIRLTTDENRQQKSQTLLHTLDNPERYDFDIPSESAGMRQYQETSQQSRKSSSGFGKVVLALIGTLGVCAMVSCGLIYFVSLGLLDQVAYPTNYDDMGILALEQSVSGTLTEDLPIDGYTFSVEQGGTLNLSANVNEEMILLGAVYDVESEQLVGLSVLSSVFSSSSINIPEEGDYLLAIVPAELFGSNFGYGDYTFTADLR